MKRTLLRLSPLAICLALSQPVRAIDYTWSATNGNWSNSVNWTPLSGPPDAGDSATIIGDALNQVSVQLNANVLGSTSPSQMSLGEQAKFNTNGFQINVDGQVNVWGAGNTLDIRPVNANNALFGFEADTLSLGPSGQVRLLDGKAKVGDLQLTSSTMWFDGNTTLQGSSLIIGNGSGTLDARINVLGSGLAQLVGPVSFLSDANVDLFNGTTLRLANQAIFYGGGEFTGSGLLRFDGATTSVQGATTINMPAGRVDLDGSEDAFAAGQKLVVNDDLIIKAASIDEANNTFGTSRIIGEDVIGINSFGTLTVQLTDANDAWTMNGHLDIHAPTGQLIAGNLDGSDMILKGTATVAGNSAWQARTKITGKITIEADSYLRLSGGDLLHPNELQGGTVEGAGTLGELVDDAVVGYGTIQTKIEFLNNSRLLADNGTLTLGPDSEIVAVGLIGTRDHDGILDVQKAWNSQLASVALELKGGQVIGSPLTNGGTTRGFGRLGMSSFENLGQIDPTGGELVIDTATPPDLDGSLFRNGSIDATNGDLRVTQNLSDSYGSSLTIGPGHQVTFEQGWTLAAGAVPFASAGSLHLNGGPTSADAAVIAGGKQTLAGIVNVDQEAAFEAPTEFGASVNVNLPGNADRLRLFAPASIAAGAFFAGNGQLVNVAQNSLTLLAGSSVGVTVNNAGTLLIDDSMADATVDALLTTALSRLHFDVRGLAPADVDALHVNHEALLAGYLAIDTNQGSGSYSDPVAPGDFDTISLIQANSINNRFQGLIYNGSSLAMTSLSGDQDRYHVGAGLFRIVDYGTDLVQLINYRALPGDADGDGRFDTNDFVKVFQAGEYEDAIADNSDWTEGDWTGDLDFGSDDFIAAFQGGNYEQPSILPARTAVAIVPEPTSLAAWGLLLTAWFLRRRRS